MEYKEFTVKEYADQLESTGRLSFGEPSVQYEIKNNKEEVKFYLEFSKHGTHSLLGECSLYKNESAVRNFIFNKGLIFQKYSLSEFVKEFSERSFKTQELQPITMSTAKYLGRASSTKHLTLYLASKILNQDLLRDESNEFSYFQAQNILKRNYSAIGKPEHIAYMSRLDYFSEKEQAEFIDLPLEYMVKSFIPPSKYKEITLPRKNTSSLPPFMRDALAIN